MRQGNTWSFVIRLADLTVVFERRRPGLPDKSFLLAVAAVETALAERDRGNADMTSNMKLVAT